jgi:hypothetical protein
MLMTVIDEIYNVCRLKKINYDIEQEIYFKK